jgi:hypothetical protein
MAVELAIYLLASAGMSIIVTRSRLFSPLRDLFELSEEKRKGIALGDYSPSFSDKLALNINKLLSCPLCFGFWAGLIIYFLRDYYWGMVFCYCLCASIVSLVIYSIVDR